MLLHSFETVRQPVRCLRRIQEQRVRIQFFQFHTDHRLCGLHCGTDVFDIPSAHHEFVIGDRSQVFFQQPEQFIGQTSQCLFPSGEDSLVATGVEEGLLRGEHEQLRVGKLLVQKLHRRTQRSFLRFNPVGSVVAEEVRRRIEADLIAVLLGQDLRLPDVGIVLRLQAPGRTGELGDVELIRRDIPVLLRDDPLEFPGAAPDLRKLLVRQRRLALGGLIHENLVRGIVPAVALDHSTGKPGERRIPAAFLYYMAAVAALVHPGVEILLGKELVQGLGAGNEICLRIFGSKEEPGRVERIGIDIGELSGYLLFHGAVGFMIRDLVDLQKSMELRSRGLAVFLLQMMSAVMDADRHIREGGPQVLRRHPLVRILGVVVIKLHSEAVAPYKIGIAAVTVFILGADIIMADRLRQ